MSTAGEAGSLKNIRGKPAMDKHPGIFLWEIDREVIPYASESGISPSALWATWLEFRLNLAFCFDERRELWEATKNLTIQTAV